MTTLEGNKLIAEFMGGEICGGKIEVVMQGNERGPVVTNRVSDLKYHSSWDLLMPVVEKIESDASQETGHCEIHIVENHCRIYRFSPTKEFIKTFNSSSKILSVWEAVIQYIQWYNSQSKNIKK